MLQKEGKNKMIIKTLTLFSVFLSTGCTGFISVINNSFDEVKISPVGTIHLFDVSATVQYKGDTQTQTEKVRGRVTKHIKTDVLREKRQYSYEHNGAISFINNKGDELIIYTGKKYNSLLDKTFYGAKIKYNNGRIINFDGDVGYKSDQPNAIPNSLLWRIDSVEKYGFRIIDMGVKKM